MQVISAEQVHQSLNFPVLIAALTAHLPAPSICRRDKCFR
jgi:hypothetical protein